MKRDNLDDERVFVIRNFLCEAECAELVRLSTNLAWETGTLGEEVVQDVRNNDRVVFDHRPMAADLFARAKPFLPNVFESRPLVGFNERWRFYRYGPGQAFKAHRDGAFARLELGQESRLTFMIYLNAGAVGGDTRFFADMEHAFQRIPYLTVTPEEGMALVFVHRIWHEGAIVESGMKYVLRTDVMFGLPQS
jgi:hypothetical protein